LKCSYHSDIVQESSEQLARKESHLVVDKRIGILRDCSVTWLWDAFTTVNKSDIVKKAFEMCHVHTFNLSFESLTSYAVREKLRSLKVDDPQFWDELTSHAP
ncbi:hypothetical protein DFJ58DRAFT_635311, partial [Suillus subalutaceus]|uniref:uncharacterized protein n=1 Tax=Suillus subalutaceus TaxID=48586 RepID=UPI001B87EF10